MALTWSILDSPGGHKLLFICLSGVATHADALLLEQLATPGGEGYGLPLLGMTAKGVSLSAEFRGFFGKKVHHSYPAMALVVPAAPMRALISLMVKVGRKLNPEHADAPVALFSEQGDAVAWLDQYFARAQASSAA
jgi:hypothetical protein